MPASTRRAAVIGIAVKPHLRQVDNNAAARCIGNQMARRQDHLDIGARQPWIDVLPLCRAANAAARRFREECQMAGMKFLEIYRHLIARRGAYAIPSCCAV